MSNPAGDALVAIGIRDTQQLSGGATRRALSDDSLCEQASIWSKIYYATLSVAVGAFVLVFIVL
jgi:hypothetical protein